MTVKVVDADLEKSALTVKQVARLSGYCPATIRSYICGGLLPAIKVRRAYRITRDAFDRFMTGERLV